MLNSANNVHHVYASLATWRQIRDVYTCSIRSGRYLPAKPVVCATTQSKTQLEATAGCSTESSATPT